MQTLRLYSYIRLFVEKIQAALRRESNLRPLLSAADILTFLQKLQQKTSYVSTSIKSISKQERTRRKCLGIVVCVPGKQNGCVSYVLSFRTHTRFSSQQAISSLPHESVSKNDNPRYLHIIVVVPTQRGVYI